MDPAASLFKGELWDPRRLSEDNLEQARVRLQNNTNRVMGNQAIADIAGNVLSSLAPVSEAHYKDVILKMKALAEENIRLAEPSLVAHITDYSQKKREVRGQMIKGLHPPRVRDPLLQAPIFSEDINIFPSSLLIRWLYPWMINWFFQGKPTDI